MTTKEMSDFINSLWCWSRCTDEEQRKLTEIADYLSNRGNEKNDCISRERAIERLKLNLPISYGADNSKDRYRYMQSLADIQAIRKLPPVTPQEPKEITWEDVKEYCEKRCLTIVTNQLFHELTHHQEPVLDKVRAEIDELYSYVEFDEDIKTSFNMVRLEEVQRVIDKYKAESEKTDG